MRYYLECFFFMADCDIDTRLKKKVKHNQLHFCYYVLALSVKLALRKYNCGIDSLY